MDTRDPVKKKRKGEGSGDQNDPSTEQNGPSTELRVLHAGAKAPNPSRSSIFENTGLRELELQQWLGRVKGCVVVFCSECWNGHRGRTRARLVHCYWALSVAQSQGSD